MSLSAGERIEVVYRDRQAPDDAKQVSIRCIYGWCAARPIVKILAAIASHVRLARIAHLDAG